MKLLTKIFFRSFLLQAAWNYERMQNIGFLFSILPKLKSLYGNDTGKLRESCKRYIGYFNTHPYMAPIILGLAAKQEEKINEEEDEAISNSSRTKMQMAGPLAALGDKVFWSTWRPVIGLIGVLGVLTGIKPYYIIPVAFITLYNIGIIPQKYYMIKDGYDCSAKVLEKIKRWDNQFILNSFPIIGLLIIGVCLITAFIQWGYLRGGLLIGFTCAVIILRKYFRLSATRLLYIISILVIMGNLIF